MFGHCRAPTWNRDDFTRCFQYDYLQTLFPLIVCGASLLYLLLQLYTTASKSSHPKQYRSINAWHQSRDAAALGDAPVPYSDEDTDEEDEADRNDYLSLQPTKTRESFVEVDKPRAEFWVVTIEESAVLGELGIHLAALVTHAFGNKGRIAEIAGIAIWGYVAVLASIRLLFSTSSRLSFPKLWYHTMFCYLCLWILSVLTFRSAIIHPENNLSRNLKIADFSLVSLLVLIALTSRKGNKAVELEYEDDLEPSKEQTASVLSLATFGWVDAIVWQGFKKTFELQDVWNLAPKDKAAALLMEYRQVKKTNSLAWHLLRHFRRGLIIQALWAALGGLLTFAPTLLLKKILEYVEAPTSTPRNAAWFFVILLFVSGCASALADGQALWVGRKICIRLRAVIIGEIYAKALKRRAAAGTDKVLGEAKKKPEEGEKTSLFKRIMSFGRKKKVEAGKTQEEAESDSQVSSGAIINLMAVDSFKVSEICAYLHFLWASTPVQTIMAVTLLYQILGYSSIAGIGMMIILLPINMTISKQFARIQKLILAATDARINITNEVLSNIRIIKYFAWEDRFMAQVNEKRRVELANLRRRYYWWAAAATVWS
ncbi:hypothetical protein LTS18_010181, partial [Coniosporium uncinatum]